MLLHLSKISRAGLKCKLPLTEVSMTSCWAQSRQLVTMSTCWGRWELGSSTWGSGCGWSSWGWWHQACAPTSRAAVAEQRSTFRCPLIQLICPYVSLSDLSFILALQFAPLAPLGSVWISCETVKALGRAFLVDVRPSEEARTLPDPAILASAVCHGMPWPLGGRSWTKAFWRTSARPPKPVRSRSLEAQQRSNTETPAKQPMISVDSAIAEKSWSNVEICRIQMKYMVYICIHAFFCNLFRVETRCFFRRVPVKGTRLAGLHREPTGDAPSLHALAPQSPRMSWN